MSGAQAGLLLDTCALIWLANGDRMKAEAIDAMARAAREGGNHISPVCAWEVGLLSKGAMPLAFLPDPATWFARVMAYPGMRPVPLSAAMAIASSWLPGTLHNDPADRLLIATARDTGLPIVTRDRRILAYAASGHVAAIAC